MEKKGIVHRDLKPENILIHNNVFKITDFGFSKIVDNFNSGMLSSIKGTPLYMGLIFIEIFNCCLAPQILINEQYTSKCDVWSLGLIYYEMLFGLLPWFIPQIQNNLLFRQAQTQYELIQKINKSFINFPNQPKVSQESKEFIQNCLQVSEIKRISFTQIFFHPLFKGCFNDQAKKQSEEMIQKEILQQLLNYLSQTNPSELFTHISNNSPYITYYNFQKFLKSLNESVTAEQSQSIFNLFDQNKINRIDYQSFLQTFNQQGQQINQIETREEIPLKKYSSLDQYNNVMKQGYTQKLYKSQRKLYQRRKDNQQNSFFNSEQSFIMNSNNSSYIQFSNASTEYSLSNSYSPIKKLISCLAINQELLKKQFSLFDLDDDGYLNLIDFQGLVNSTKVTLSEIDIANIFNSMDTQGLQKINFDQFFYILKKNVF